jgi:chemotaxis protein methyltransferase CheR
MFGFFRKKKSEEKILIEKVEEPADYTDISNVAIYFKDETGVCFEKQESILQNKAMTFCKQRNIASFSKLLNLVDTQPLIKQELIDYLTTNETFFYREFQQIEELVNLVKKRSSFIEILCAPSATGEEPYSIAIALLEAGISSSNFKIVGIDINSGALAKAEQALYRARNVRNLSENILSTYFNKEGELYALNNRIKSLVSFRLANIFDASFVHIGKFDYIFSRNMLIYFDKETKLKAKEILEKMRKDPNQNIFFGHADLL